MRWNFKKKKKQKQHNNEEEEWVLSFLKDKLIPLK